MISYTTGVIFLLLGIASVLVFRFYRGKFSFLFLTIGLGLIISFYVMDKVTILNSLDKKEERLAYRQSIFFSYKNGKKEYVPIKKSTLINDTEEELVIEKIEYGTSTYFIGDNVIDSVKPYSSKNISYEINFFNNTPPSSIWVKGGRSKTKYWIHKKQVF